MLDEDKIRVMTKLAVFEKEKGAVAQIASRYYKNDYISYNMIWSAVTSTVAFFLIILLFVICRLEYYIEHLQDVNFYALIVAFAAAYICYIITVEIIAFFFYRKRYRAARIALKEYCGGLKELEKIYNKEHLRQTRASAVRSMKLEGAVSNDEFIGN